MSAAASPFDGLGARERKPRSTADDDFDRPSVQRIVPATRQPALAPAAPARRKPGRPPRQETLEAPATDSASVPRTFRCAVDSDGGFMLRKGDQLIELEASELARLLHYLERMAEQPA